MAKRRIKVVRLTKQDRDYYLDHGGIHGGIRAGLSVGKTDEIGSAAVERPFHVKHSHATILHQLGLDQKLVGVEGAKPIHELLG